MARPLRDPYRGEHGDEAAHAGPRLRGLGGRVRVPAHRRPQRALAPRDGTDRDPVRGDPAGPQAGDQLPPTGLGPLLDHGTGMAAMQTPPRGDARPARGIRAPAMSGSHGDAAARRGRLARLAQVRRMPERARYDSAA